jgi:hypothetical protein
LMDERKARVIAESAPSDAESDDEPIPKP